VERLRNREEPLLSQEAKGQPEGGPDLREVIELLSLFSQKDGTCRAAGG
jgi:hypothetical protein